MENQRVFNLKVRIGKLVFFLCSVGMVISGCRSNAGIQPLAEDATEVIENFSLYHYRDGEKQWELSSPRAMTYGESAEAWLEKPRVTFYRRQKTNAVLTAERGKINLQNNDLETRGKTVVETADGQHLESRDVICEAATGKIFTREYVVIKSSTQILSGQGFATDTSLDRIVIYNEKIVSR